MGAHSTADGFFTDVTAPDKAPRLRVVKAPEPGMMDRSLAIQLLREYYADEIPTQRES